MASFFGNAASIKAPAQGKGLVYMPMPAFSGALLPGVTEAFTGMKLPFAAYVREVIVNTRFRAEGGTPTTGNLGLRVYDDSAATTPHVATSATQFLVGGLGSHPAGFHVLPAAEANPQGYQVPGSAMLNQNTIIPHGAMVYAAIDGDNAADLLTDGQIVLGLEPAY